MKLKELLIVFAVIFLMPACNPSKKSHLILPQTMKDSVNDKAGIIKIAGKTENVDNAKTSPFLENLLQQYPEYFDSILQNKKVRNVQIIYTEVNRDDKNNPRFTDYFFNVNSSQYFYPASTVKLPTALLALQKLQELQNTGITKSTTMITEDAYSGQTSTFNDPQTPDGRPNIESYIKKIFLVSDNDAFNRLYEFLGQEYLNEQLHKKGYYDAQIIHRLEISLSEDVTGTRIL